MLDLGYKKTVAVVQVRMGSSRLPGKILRKFNNGLTMLDVLLTRLKAAKSLDEIVVAYPWEQENDILNKVVFAHDVQGFRGSHEDVLDRFFRGAIVRRAGVVVRVCGDNPLTDPEVIDRCVDAFKQLGVQYLIPEGLPVGTFPEVTKIEALEAAWNEATDPADREHVTTYIRSRPETFKQYILKWEPAQWSFPRLTVDTENDFQLLNSIISRYSDPLQITLDKLKK